MATNLKSRPNLVNFGKKAEGLELSCYNFVQADKNKLVLLGNS